MTTEDEIVRLRYIIAAAKARFDENTTEGIMWSRRVLDSEDTTDIDGDFHV